MPAHANQRDQGPDRLKREPMGKLTQDVRGFGDVRTAEWTSLGMIGRSYSLVSTQAFAVGPAGCVDWMMFMRGAAALAFLSLQHINLRFDWMKEQISNSPKSKLLSTTTTTTTSVLNQPKIPCAFNDLWVVVHDKA